MSYLFTWGSIFLKPGSNAVVSLIFAEYLNKLFFHATSSDASSTDIPQWAVKVTAIGAVVSVSVLCVATPSLGTRTAVVFTTVKVAALVSSENLCHYLPHDGAQGTSLDTRLHSWTCATGQRQSFNIFNGTIVRRIKYQPRLVCACVLLWAMGLRWLGSG